MDHSNSFESNNYIHSPYHNNNNTMPEPSYYYNRRSRNNRPEKVINYSDILTYSFIDASMNLIKVYNNARYQLPSKRVLVVSREEWKAKPAKWKDSFNGKIKYVFFTSTRTTTCWNMETCKVKIASKQEAQMARGISGQDDIIYNFIIGGDSNVYVGRGWYTRPDLPRQYRDLSNNSLLIGFVGRFHYQAPSEDMMRTANKLIKDGLQLNVVEPKVLEIVLPP